jgi:hypothetical protein
MSPHRTGATRRHPRSTWKAPLTRLWAWLTGTGYRPERHYMRGGRTHAAGSRA